MSKPHEILRDWRLKQGLSCAEIAKKLGVAETTVRSLENGHRPITAERAVAIENVIGIPRHALRPDLYPVSQEAAA